MADGLQILNDTSNIQIDSTYRNMSLASKTVGNTFLHSIDNISAFKAPDNIPFSIRCYSENSIDCFYETSVDVNAFNYGWSAIPNASGVGLEVYSPSGVLTYSSETRPLRVLDFVTLNIANISGAVVFRKNYPGKSIAIIPSQIPYNWERHDQNLRGYSTIFTISGSMLSVTYGIAKEWYAYAGSLTGSAARNDVFQPYANFLVVDVSGY